MWKLVVESSYMVGMFNSARFYWPISGMQQVAPQNNVVQIKIHMRKVVNEPRRTVSNSDQYKHQTKINNFKPFSGDFFTGHKLQTRMPYPSNQLGWNCGPQILRCIFMQIDRRETHFWVPSIYIDMYIYIYICKQYVYTYMFM